MEKVIVKNTLKAKEKKPLFFILACVFVVVFTVVAGFFLTLFFVKKIDDSNRKLWLNLIETAAAAVNPDRIRDWIPGEPDQSTADFKRVSEQLILISTAVGKEKIHPLYLMQEKDDRIFIQFDASSPTSSEYAEVGSWYKDVPSEVYDLFKKGGSASVGPYGDVYGQFISSFVSIKDTKDGKILAVLGADITTEDWRKMIVMWYGIFIVFLSLVIIVEILIFAYMHRHKKFEEELAVSEDHFRSIVDASLNVIFRTNKDGTFTFISKSVFELTGFTTEEIIGQNFIKFASPSEQPLLFQNFNRILVGETVRNFEGFLMKKDGSRFFVEFNVTPIFNDGEVGEIQGIIHDITARKQNEELVKHHAEEMEKNQKAVLNILEDVSEEKDKNLILVKDLEKFKLAVDNTSDHIVITDSEGIVLYANAAAEKITGYKIEQALGKKAAVLWKMPMPKEFYVKMWDTIKNKKKVFIGEIKNRRKNGEVYDALISISPVIGHDGNIQFFVALERDITREKEIDRAKSEFVSLASHQLRTPLSTINWYTEMLLNGDVGEIKGEQKQYLQEIYKGNQRMVDLVNSLLNVSRLELGTFTVEPKLIDVRKIADQAIDDLKHKVEEKKQILNKEYDNNIKELMLDEKLTMMIFQNLLSNAVKYTPEKGKIDVKIKIVGKNLEIAVADSGMGIPKIQQDKIFTKLFRADNVRQTDTEGTGLGLYIIKSILDNTGGKIKFESEENKGTTFFLTMPISGMKQKEGTKQLS